MARGRGGFGLFDYQFSGTAAGGLRGHLLANERIVPPAVAAARAVAFSGRRARSSPIPAVPSPPSPTLAEPSSPAPRRHRRACHIHGDNTPAVDDIVSAVIG